jgi:uncharacterized protein
VITAQDAAVIAAQLGRPPRGLLGVAHRCPCGLPDVAETAPRLADGSPFPTLYYLTCPRANAVVSRLEASGLMRDMTARLADDALRRRYESAHRDYLTRREAAARAAGVEPLPPGTPSAGGMPERVKCLHALVAHELAAGGVNPFGREALRAAGKWWLPGPCVPARLLQPETRPRPEREGVAMKFGYRLTWVISLVAVAALTVFLPAAHAAPAPRHASSSSLCGAMDGTHPTTVSNVMFIVFENKSYGNIVGNSSAPYLNDTLIAGCGLATDYHNYSHPSTPNYLALTSGTVQGKASSRDCPPADCPQSQASIFSQLGSAGRAWGEYAEAMPGNCVKKNYDNTSYTNANGSTGEYYYVRHAPPPYYTTAPVPAECSKWDVPLGTINSGAFLSALSPSSDGLPAFSFVTPGGCDDMHDCSTTVGDDWLREWIPVIQQSAAYQTGQLVVFITWDEGVGADKANGETCWDAAHASSSAYPSCHIATIVMSPFTSPGTRSGDYFNHLSLLGTAEDLLGLPRLATTQGYAGLQSAFGL